MPDSAGLMGRGTCTKRSCPQSFYTARLGDSVQVANTSMRWGGRTWAMVLTPLPVDSVERGILLMHEVWHSVQAQVGDTAASLQTIPQHRDGVGAHWLKVEATGAGCWRSRRRERRNGGRWAMPSLRGSGAEPHCRGVTATERPLELSEGLAEYTGIVVVVVPADERARVGRDETGAAGDGAASLMRSFPYATGTAWALLLDIDGPGMADAPHGRAVTWPTWRPWRCGIDTSNADRG